MKVRLRKRTNERNKNPKPFIWTKAAAQILGTLAAYCERITTQDTRKSRVGLVRFPEPGPLAGQYQLVPVLGAGAVKKEV